MLGVSQLIAQVQQFSATLESQLLATGAVLAGLFVLSELVRRVGPPLKARSSDLAVETAQAMTTALLWLLGAGALVVVWRATPQVLLVMDVLNFTRTDLIKLALSVALLAGSYTLTRATKRVIRRLATDRGAISRHQQEVAHHLVQIGIFLVVFFAILSLWKVPIGNLLLGAGFLGVVVGLAARQTLGAVLAGFVVLFSRPFELGDWIEVADREGIVQDISIVNTELKTFDDEVVMIPNDIVTATEVVNRSRSGRYRTHVDVGVDYDTDLDVAAGVAEDVLADAELPMEKPTPHVVLTEFGDSAVGLRLRFWISNPTAGREWRAKTEVIQGVKEAFEAEGIEIPFPQRELMARQAEGGFRISGDLDGDVTALAGQQAAAHDGEEADDGGSDGGGEADERSKDADGDDDQSDEAEAADERSDGGQGDGS
ncbi:MAG: mechanosensitive ion channel family protein [Haloferacaceae archaeon]